MKGNKSFKSIAGLPDSLEDETQTSLIILDDVIFQASDPPEVVQISTDDTKI